MRIPQKIPDTKLAIEPCAILVSTIAVAASATLSPIGNKLTAMAQAAAPTKLPIHILNKDIPSISPANNNPALPVNKLNLKVTIVISPREKNRAPGIPPTMRLIIPSIPIKNPAIIDSNSINSLSLLFCILIYIILKKITKIKKEV